MSDRYQPLKFMGYCMSQLPPDGVETTFVDFLNYAKFQLCLDKGILMQDAVWDKYTDEAILVEYYANVFAKSKEERQKFEISLAAEGDSMDDFATWADSQIAKNQEEMADKAKKLEDSVSFKPETIGE